MQRISLGSKATRLAAVLTLAVVIVLAGGASAFAVANNNISTAIPIPTPLPVPVTLDGSATADGDSAVYSVYLEAGDALFAGVITGDYVFNLEVYAPTATDIWDAIPVEWMPSLLGDINYVAPTSGTYYLHIWAPPAEGGDPAAVGTANLWAGAMKKTSVGLTTSYLTSTGTKTTTASSLIVGFDTFCMFDGVLNAVAGPVPYEGISVLRQFPGGKVTKIATAWTFNDGTFGYIPIPVTGVRRKVTYTFQYGGSDPESQTAEGLGFSYASVTITPRPLITTPASASTVTHKKTFTMSGFLLPRHTSGSYPVKLYCYRNERGVWRLRKTVNARAYNSTYMNYNMGYYQEPATKYSASVALPYAGKWRIRAYHGDADHYGTYTSYKLVTAK